MSGIYIHIPVCAQKCAYCDFYSVASPSLLEKLLPLYIPEIRHRKDFFKEEALPLRTLYFGGGTPSLCNASDIQSLIETCRETFRTDFSEITLEANPDDLTPAYLESLLEAGVNRLSIGVQTFNDEWLKKMNRRHTASDSENAILNARKTGFTNISIDWIYGLDLDKTEWERDLECFVRTGVEHLSAYHLSIEENTVLARMIRKGLYKEILEEDSERQYGQLTEALAKAGYEHYEISNFCKKGFASGHNRSYWEYEPYLGIGPGAHGFDGQKRYANYHNVHSYTRCIHAKDWDQLCCTEIPNESERYNEYVFTALRTSKGVRLNELNDLFGEEVCAHFLKQATKGLNIGRLCRTEDSFFISDKYWLISNAIIRDYIL